LYSERHSHSDKKLHHSSRQYQESEKTMIQQGVSRMSYRERNKKIQQSLH